MSNYDTARLQFEKTIEKMQQDLQKYAEHDAAKDSYIDKQNNIIKSLIYFLNTVETEKRFWQSENKELRELLMKNYNMLKAHNIVLEMAHVIFPHPVMYPLTDIEFFYQCHIESCKHSCHDHSKRITTQAQLVKEVFELEKIKL